MKTLEQIKKELDALEEIFGFNPNTIEQGSPEWLQMKLGVMSASNAHKIIAGAKTATRMSYLSELVAEIATREKPEISAKPLEWGKENELAARSIYEFETGYKIKELPFIFKDESLRVGISPDGYGEIGLELKCPYTSKVFIDFACLGIIKNEYKAQCQFSMWVTGATQWHFANFDPRSTCKQFHYTTLERDEKMMKKFDECVPECIEQMDEMLAKLGIEYGYQWHAKADKVA